MAVCVRQEIYIETWAGPTFEVPHMVTGPFTVSRDGAHGSAPLSCARHLLSHLRECYIQPFGGKRYEKPDNVTATMYVAMADVLAVKQLPVVTLSMMACRYIPL